MKNTDYTLLTYGELQNLACEHGDRQAEQQMERNQALSELLTLSEYAAHVNVFWERRKAAGLPGPKMSQMTTTGRVAR